MRNASIAITEYTVSMTNTELTFLKLKDENNNTKNPTTLPTTSEVLPLKMMR